MFTYLPLPVDDRVPDGYRLIVAYAKDDTVVVPIEPVGLSDEQHNCDWEGCSTLDHVVRFSVSHKYATDARLAAAEASKRTVPQLPTLAAVQQAVVNAQLCAHGQVEIPVLVKFIYSYLDGRSWIDSCPHHKRDAQCIWGLRGCCNISPCRERPELREETNSGKE